MEFRKLTKEEIRKNSYIILLTLFYTLAFAVVYGWWTWLIWKKIGICIIVIIFCAIIGTFIGWIWTLSSINKNEQIKDISNNEKIEDMTKK